MAVIFFSSQIPLSYAEAIDSLYVDEINLVKGELETVTVYSLTRLSLTDPSVADIISADDKQLLFIAKAPGQTTLFIWDEHGKRALTVNVYPQDLYLMKERMSKLLQTADITEIKLEINAAEGKIMVLGDVPEHKKALFDQIVGLFSSNVISFSKTEEIQDLIQIDMQVTELNETLAETIGIDWNDALTYNETKPTFDDGTISDLLKIGDFARATALAATVNALVTEGKGRVLSKPRLVVLSGKEASFLVGGQIPIRTTTVSETGAVQENIEFKDYGVSMNITPTLKKGKIDILLKVNVSDVDTSSAGTSTSSVGFTTRTASTQLYLDDGQLIVIAGLIKRNNSTKVGKVPFLGDIPLLGLLFRNKSSPAELDQELVISLTPHILTKRGEGSSTASTKKDIYVAAPKSQGSAPDAKASEVIPESSTETLGIPSSGMIEYARAVQRRVMQAIDYPSEAVEKGWEGTVKLALLIQKDGTLLLASVKESSGYQIFDDYTLNTAKSIAPYSSFPADAALQELNVTIPVVYSLKQLKN